MNCIQPRAHACRPPGVSGITTLSVKPREEPMTTTQNLKDAFAGESQANRKYLAYARKAEADGFPQVAKLFRAVAEAETIHAHAHLRVLGGVQTTAANLQDAIAGEEHEFKKMYPGFLAEAEAEKNKPAALSFRYALGVEEVHHGLYSAALATVKAGKDLAAGKIWLCAICGHTHLGDEAPDKCPVCGAIKAKYFEVK
jgi:rubrerythrin